MEPHLESYRKLYKKSGLGSNGVWGSMLKDSLKNGECHELHTDILLDNCRLIFSLSETNKSAFSGESYQEQKGSPCFRSPYSSVVTSIIAIETPLWATPPNLVVSNRETTKTFLSSFLSCKNRCDASKQHSHVSAQIAYSENASLVFISYLKQSTHVISSMRKTAIIIFC